MPAPIDLTWQQFADALSEAVATQISSATYTTDGETARLVINFATPSAVVASYVANPSKGVVKALFQLLEGARKAQERLNENKPAGERLAAFPAPTIGNQANGQVPIERRIASRVDLSSATAISGITA